MRFKWCFVVRFLSTLFLGFAGSLSMTVPPVFAASSSTNQHCIAYLTFDDGPSLMYTPKILHILQQNRVPATFFVLGTRVERFPTIAKAIVQQGNEIGNHGYSHEFLSNKQSTWVILDVKKTDEVIRTTTGKQPTYYRPPGGIITSPEARSIRLIGHPIALWTVDSEDWRATNSNRIVQEVLKHAQPNCIILMHDGVSSSRYTVQALPIIIRTLKARGYEFRTLPQAERLTAGPMDIDNSNIDV